MKVKIRLRIYYLLNSAKESKRNNEAFIEYLLEIIFEFDSPCAELKETLFSKLKSLNPATRYYLDMMIDVADKQMI